jgi:hypothetical protein
MLMTDCTKLCIVTVLTELEKIVGTDSVIILI